MLLPGHMICIITMVLHSSPCGRFGLTHPLCYQQFNDLMNKPCETWVVDTWANSGMVRRLYDFDGVMEAHTRVVVVDHTITDIKAEEPPVQRRDAVTSVTNGVSYSFSQKSANNKVQVCGDDYHHRH